MLPTQINNRWNFLPIFLLIFFGFSFDFLTILGIYIPADTETILSEERNTYLGKAADQGTGTDQGKES